MIAMEIILGVQLLSLGIISAITDIRKGLVYNRVLLVYLITGAISALVYYVFFARDYVITYLLNLAIVSIVSVALFLLHSFAGGDTKLAIVMSMLFPARFYCAYNGSLLTLMFAVCFAILFGYIFILVSSVGGLITKKTHVRKGFVKDYLKVFVKSYILIFPFIVLMNLLAQLVERYLFRVNTLILVALCFLLAWLIGRFKIMKKWYIWGPVVIADIVLSIILRVVPISLSPLNYVFTLLIIIFQMTIKTGIYKTIPTSEIQKGMILATGSSLMFQDSRVKGLPHVSSEDLRDRLTEDEAAAVRRWGETDHGTDTIVIMRKIPFAVFILLGYVAYFSLWGALTLFCGVL